MEINVSLDVFKALTVRLAYEGHTFDDVLRELLALDSPVEIDQASAEGSAFSRIVDGFEPAAKALTIASRGSGFYSRGLFLPDGTELRARYKGRLFTAKIVGENWLDDDGNEHLSPSAAATAITGNSVNGWRFWEAKRPVDNLWRRLDGLK